MGGHQRLNRLLDESEGRANRSVLTTLAYHHFGGATEALAFLVDGLDEAHEHRVRGLVGQAHRHLLDRQAARFDLGRPAGGNAEDVVVLAPGALGDQEPREVGEHAGVDELAPGGGDAVGQIAEQMAKADRIEAEAADERELHEIVFRQHHLVVFAPVAADLEDLPALAMDGHFVGQRQAVRLAVVLMLEARDIELAIGFVELVILIFRPRRILVLADAADFFRLQGGRGLVGDARVAKHHIAPGAHQHHAADDRAAHEQAVGDPAGVVDAVGRIVDDQVFAVDCARDRPPKDGVMVDFLEHAPVEPDPQQHGVGVGDPRFVYDGEVVVHVYLERVGEIIQFQCTGAGVFANLDRAVAGAKLAESVSAEADDCLCEQCRSDLGLAFERR